MHSITAGQENVVDLDAAMQVLREHGLIKYGPDPGDPFEPVTGESPEIQQLIWYPEDDR